MMKQESMGKTEHRWQIFLAFVTNAYLFFLCSTKWNAGVSISASLVGIAVLLLYGYKKRKIQWPPKLFLIPYLIFMGSVLLASVLTGDGPSIQAAKRFVSVSFPFWLLYLALQQGKSLEHCSQWGMLLGTLTLNCYALSEFFRESFSDRINGVAASPNNFAMILEVILPFFWLSVWQLKEFYVGKGKKVFFAFFSLLSLTTTFFLFVTKSRGGIAGFILGALCTGLIFIIQKKKIVSVKKSIGVLMASLVVMSGAIFVGTVHYYRRSYDNERILLLRSAYAIWQDHKIYGVGFKAWNRIYRQKYILPGAKEPNLMLPHNNIADFFSCAGLLGGFGYLIFNFGTLIFLLKDIRRHPENMYSKAMFWCWIAMFIHGMVDNTAYAKYSGRLFYAMWAVTLISCFERKNDE